MIDIVQDLLVMCRAEDSSHCVRRLSSDLWCLIPGCQYAEFQPFLIDKGAHNTRLHHNKYAKVLARCNIVIGLQSGKSIDDIHPSYRGSPVSMQGLLTAIVSHSTHGDFG